MKLSDVNLLSFGHTIQMTGVVFTGEGQMFIAPFPGSNDEYCVPGQIDMSLEDWTTLLKQLDTLETEILEKAADGTVTKAILRKSQRVIEGNVSWGVFKRDGFACRYCGRDDAPLSVDHIILWEERGASVPENLIAACKKCNKVRGSLPYAKWLAHPRYLDVSKNLTAAQRQANEDVVKRLDSIPRNAKVRTR